VREDGKEEEAMELSRSPEVCRRQQMGNKVALLHACWFTKKHT